MNKKPPKRLTKEIKELYRKVNEYRNNAQQLECEIQKWFNNRGLEMMSENIEGELLSFLSGDALIIHETLQYAYVELEQAYNKHLNKEGSLI